MVKQITEDIYSIGVPLSGNPLKELNSYWIRGTQRDLLIDTGFRCRECEDALREGLKELGSGSSRLDIITTHLHSDHTGLCQRIAGKDSKIYISKTDFTIMKDHLFGDGSHLRHQRYIREGFPKDLLEYADSINPASEMAIESPEGNFCYIGDQDKIEIGDHILTAVSTPGHTPGHMMFWMEQPGIMFTGDHILFDISPNITAWNGVEDSLGNYLDSLRAAGTYPVTLALPGHRKEGDYHQRIRDLTAHHHRRLDEVIQILSQTPGMNAYDITGLMRWKIRARNWDEFPPVQKFFAVCECLAHLDNLVKQGKVICDKGNHIWTYELSGQAPH